MGWRLPVTVGGTMNSRNYSNNKDNGTVTRNSSCSNSVAQRSEETCRFNLKPVAKRCAPFSSSSTSIEFYGGWHI